MTDNLGFEYGDFKDIWIGRSGSNARHDQQQGQRMTPAENKQTVERVIRDLETNLRLSRDSIMQRKYQEDIAALRDLVAQADRAAELEAALREIRMKPYRAEEVTARVLAGAGGGA